MTTSRTSSEDDFRSGDPIWRTTHDKLKNTYAPRSMQEQVTTAVPKKSAPRTKTRLRFARKWDFRGSLYWISVERSHSPTWNTSNMVSSMKSGLLDQFFLFHTAYVGLLYNTAAAAADAHSGHWIMPQWPTRFNIWTIDNLSAMDWGLGSLFPVGSGRGYTVIAVTRHIWSLEARERDLIKQSIKIDEQWERWTLCAIQTIHISMRCMKCGPLHTAVRKGSHCFDGVS